MKKSYSSVISFALLTAVVFLFLLPSVLAIQTLPTVKQNTCVNLPQLYANSSFQYVINVQLPNKTFINYNQPMTKNGAFFNFTFCSTSQLGDYIVNGIGDVDGQNQTWAFDFPVTTTGSQGTNTIPLFLLLGGVILFALALYEKNEFIGLFGGFLFIVGGVYMMIFGLGLFADMYTRALSFISLGVGLVICFVAVVEMFYTPLGITGEKE